MEDGLKLSLQDISTLLQDVASSAADLNGSKALSKDISITEDTIILEKPKVMFFHHNILNTSSLKSGMTQLTTDARRDPLSPLYPRLIGNAV